MPKEYQLKGEHPMKVRLADIPSNILWENLELTKMQRFKRKLLFVFVLFLAMLITTSMVIAGSYYNNIIE